MRRLSYGESLVSVEIYPHSVRVKERRKRRHLNNTLYDYRVARKTSQTTAYCRDALCLIQAGIDIKLAYKMLDRLY